MVNHGRWPNGGKSNSLSTFDVPLTHRSQFTIAFVCHLCYIRLRMQWMNFDPSMLPQSERAVHVTLDRRGQFYLNREAVIKLGEPVAVRVMFNKEAGLIGIAAAPLNGKGSFELRSKHGSESAARTFIAKSFCNLIEILPERTLLFLDPRIEDGVLVLDLNSTDCAPRRAASLEFRINEVRQESLPTTLSDAEVTDG